MSDFDEITADLRQEWQGDPKWLREAVLEQLIIATLRYLQALHPEHGAFTFEEIKACLQEQGFPLREDR